MKGNAEQVAKALGKARPSGKGWIALCPAHDDSNPSLSLADGSEGKILVKCHAGCSQKAVLDQLRCRHLIGSRDSGWAVEAEYSYTDAVGNVLYQVVRLKGKKFFQRRPDGSGGWLYKKHPEQVLYRLPEVLQAPIVFVVEGEKDVETLRSHGFVATTNAGGASAPWLDTFTQSLQGKEVIVIPDSDAPGKKRAISIARRLLGHVARLIVFQLPVGTKDISDWFAGGNRECELIALLEGADAT